MSFPDFLETQDGKKVLKIQVSKKQKTSCTDDTSTNGKTSEEGASQTENGNNDDLKSDQWEHASSQNGNNDDGKSDQWNNGSCHPPQWGWRHWEHGGHSNHGCGGSFKWLKVIKALKDDGVLNSRILASLFVQWLPFITQKVTRKLDK